MAELITGFSAEIEDQPDQVEEEVSQYLTFLIAGKTYAVGILDVDEIIESSEITEVPMAPDYIRGVINLRTKVVAIIDLAVRMKRGSRELNKRSCVILVSINLTEGTEQTVGMLVDEVREIVEIGQENIQPTPTLGDDINMKFIQAMGRIDDHFIILLDIDQLLSSEQIGQIEQLTVNQTEIVSEITE